MDVLPVTLCILTLVTPLVLAALLVRGVRLSGALTLLLAECFVVMGVVPSLGPITGLLTVARRVVARSRVLRIVIPLSELGLPPADPLLVLLAVLVVLPLLLLTVGRVPGPPVIPPLLRTRVPCNHGQTC